MRQPPAVTTVKEFFDPARFVLRDLSSADRASEVYLVTARTSDPPGGHGAGSRWILKRSAYDLSAANELTAGWLRYTVGRRWVPSVWPVTPGDHRWVTIEHVETIPGAGRIVELGPHWLRPDYETLVRQIRERDEYAHGERHLGDSEGEHFAGQRWGRRLIGTIGKPDDPTALAEADEVGDERAYTLARQLIDPAEPLEIILDDLVLGARERERDNYLVVAAADGLRLIPISYSASLLGHPPADQEHLAADELTQAHADDATLSRFAGRVWRLLRVLQAVLDSGRLTPEELRHRYRATVAAWEHAIERLPEADLDLPAGYLDAAGTLLASRTAALREDLSRNLATLGGGPARQWTGAVPEPVWPYVRDLDDYDNPDRFQLLEASEDGSTRRLRDVDTGRRWLLKLRPADRAANELLIARTHEHLGWATPRARWAVHRRRDAVLLQHVEDAPGAGLYLGEADLFGDPEDWTEPLANGLVRLLADPLQPVRLLLGAYLTDQHDRHAAQVLVTKSARDRRRIELTPVDFECSLDDPAPRSLGDYLHADTVDLYWDLTLRGVDQGLVTAAQVAAEYDIQVEAWTRASSRIYLGDIPKPDAARYRTLVGGRLTELRRSRAANLPLLSEPHRPPDPERPRGGAALDPERLLDDLTQRTSPPD